MFHLLVLLLALIQVLKEAQHSIVISSFQGRPSTEKVVDKVEYTTFFFSWILFVQKKISETIWNLLFGDLFSRHETLHVLRITYTIKPFFEKNCHRFNSDNCEAGFKR